MTMPSLIAKHQEKRRVEQLSVVYSQLSQAVNRMIIDQDATIDMWGATKEERIAKFNELLPKYLSVIESCNYYKQGKCIGRTYFFPALNESNYGCDFFSSCYLLKSGVGLRVRASGTCQQDTTLSKKGYSEMDTENNTSIFYGTYNHDCGNILVDLNGAAGPNKVNVDAFTFKIVQNGIVPAGSAKENIWTETFDNQCLNKNPTINSFGYCTAWLIYNKNMDYLHCPEKLGWDKASSCK